MRFSSSDICRKVKKEWSAPVLVTVLLLVSLLVIFAFESIGFANPHQKSFRLSNEKSNDLIKREIILNKSKKDSGINDRITESKAESVINLIFEAAENQINYEINISSSNDTNNQVEGAQEKGEVEKEDIFFYA